MEAGLREIAKCRSGDYQALIRDGGLKQAEIPPQLSVSLLSLLKTASEGDPADFEKLTRMQHLNTVNKGWLTSRNYWDFVVDTYLKNYPEGSFAEYFWTFLGLNTILLDSFHFIREIPKADVYHSLSSGFAGFAGSLAKNIRGIPLVVTEQGLYLVERRSELSRQNNSEWYGTHLMKFSESLVKTSYQYADKIIPPCYSHVKLERKWEQIPKR